jgi:hypothetical protein
MIRKPRQIVSECWTCHRGGWKRHEPYALRTEEEQFEMWGKIEQLPSAPEGAEICDVTISSSITEAIKEGKELANLLNKPVAFDFNRQLVVVYKDSNVDQLYRKWWFDMYGETPEESYAKR